VSDADKVTKEALARIAAATTEAKLERLRIELLGRKGKVTALKDGIGELPPAERPAAGRQANEAARTVEAALAARREDLEQARVADLEETEAVDMTFPGPPLPRGFLHPLPRMQRELETVMEGLGYHVEIGPEVESDWYNFEALNLPKGHAARDAQDSFFFSEELLLRTQTSPVQIRAMERLKTPPIYVITPGRVYRRDATDATRLSSFMQMECLAVDEGLTVGDLKGTVLYMCQSMFGEDRRIRMRPSFFPFTEPSFEFDLSCGICNGQGCKSCRGKGWLEIGGCGMVHPQVLRNGGIDPERYSGFAYGFGIERLAMLKHNVEDIRQFYDNDVRFLEQLA
jgi:phenylalanyl-tRNA synthetase alpha chain